MFEESTKSHSPLRTFWPDVSDRDGAMEAIKLGYFACFIVAALDTIVGLLGSKAILADALMFAVLGVFVRRKARTAAVIAVAYMALNIVVSVLRFPMVGIITIILFVCLISSVRGTFAYRRLMRAGTSSGIEGTGTGV